MRLTERSADEMDDLYREGEPLAEHWLRGAKTHVLASCLERPELIGVVCDCLTGTDVNTALNFLGFLRNTKIED
jgi:hypothetical protein